MLCALDRVAANADSSGLAKARRSCLAHSLVRQSARARHNAHLTWQMDMARHNADFTFAWRDDTGAIGAYQARMSLPKHA